jgi:hypothetical protein
MKPTPTHANYNHAGNVLTPLRFGGITHALSLKKAGSEREARLRLVDLGREAFGLWRRKTLMWLLVVVAISSAAGGSGGLTLTRFNNTALRGRAAAAPASISSLVDIADCQEATCGKPSSLLLSGRLATPAPGHYGFNLTFEPPLTFPSPEAYARLWVNDHLQHPRCTTGWAPRNGVGQSGRSAPLWIPLPPRALNPEGVSMAQPGGGNQSSFEVRMEYVCLALRGCTPRKISLQWATYPPSPPTDFTPEFSPIPSSALVPTQSEPEQRRRALAAKLQSGWLTSYYPSMWAFVLHPESFIVRVGLYRLSTGAFLSAEGITPTKQQLGRPENNPTMTHAVRAGMHAWNSSFTQTHVMWIGEGGNVNVSLSTTLSHADNSQLTLVADVVPSATGISVNRSDYLLVVYPNFTHGRAGTVAADSHGISGVSAGLRATTLSLIQGAATTAVRNASVLPPAHLAVSLETNVVFSTDRSMTAAAVLTQTEVHRAQELAALAK